MVEADHKTLHDQQRRLVPLSLLSDDGKDTHHGIYLNRPAVERTRLGWRHTPEAGWRHTQTPEPPQAA